MTLDQAYDIADAMDLLYVEATVRESYSGRGMYGESVPALVVDGPGDAMAIGYAAAQAGVSWEDVPKRTDDMGLGMVIY